MYDKLHYNTIDTAQPVHHSYFKNSCYTPKTKDKHYFLDQYQVNQMLSEKPIHKPGFVPYSYPQTVSGNTPVERINLETSKRIMANYANSLSPVRDKRSQARQRAIEAIFRRNRTFESAILHTQRYAW